MKKNKKMILFLAISALIALGLQAWDDEKLFTTIVGGKGKSNVVFVQDTSGSMCEIIYHPDFNPTISLSDYTETIPSTLTKTSWYLRWYTETNPTKTINNNTTYVIGHTFTSTGSTTGTLLVGAEGVNILVGDWVLQYDPSDTQNIAHQAFGLVTAKSGPDSNRFFTLTLSDIQGTFIHDYRLYVWASTASIDSYKSSKNELKVNGDLRNYFAVNDYIMLYDRDDVHNTARQVTARITKISYSSSITTFTLDNINGTISVTGTQDTVYYRRPAVTKLVCLYGSNLGLDGNQVYYQMNPNYVKWIFAIADDNQRSQVNDLHTLAHHVDYNAYLRPAPAVSPNAARALNLNNTNKSETLLEEWNRVMKDIYPDKIANLKNPLDDVSSTVFYEKHKASFPTYGGGFKIKIDAETMLVSSNVLDADGEWGALTVTRGINNTIAVKHAANSAIMIYNDAGLGIDESTPQIHLFSSMQHVDESTGDVDPTWTETVNVSGTNKTCYRYKRVFTRVQVAREALCDVVTAKNKLLKIADMTPAIDDAATTLSYCNANKDFNDFSATGQFKAAPFYIKVSDPDVPGNDEIMKVTAHDPATYTLTVTRGQRNTSACSHANYADISTYSGARDLVRFGVFDFPVTDPQNTYYLTASLRVPLNDFGKKNSSGQYMSSSYINTSVLDVVNSLIPSGGTPLAKALALVWNYLKPNANSSAFGANYIRQTGGSDWLAINQSYGFEQDPTTLINHPKGSPMEYWCQENYVVLITDGRSESDSDLVNSDGRYGIFSKPWQRSAAAASIVSDFFRFDYNRATYPTQWGDSDYGKDPTSHGADGLYCLEGTCWAGSGTDFLDDVAFFLYNQDMFPTKKITTNTWDSVNRIFTSASGEPVADATLYNESDTDPYKQWPGNQNIKTNTVGLCIQNDMLIDTAKNGGGQNYTAFNYQDLSAAFLNIITSVQLAQDPMSYTTYAAPKQSITGDKYGYVAHFIPRERAMWEGHLRRYLLGDDGSFPANIDSVTDEVIVDGAPIVSFQWDAGVVLKNRTTARMVYTSIPSGSVWSPTPIDFMGSSVGAAELGVSTSEQVALVKNFIQNFNKADGDNNTSDYKDLYRLGETFHFNPQLVGYPLVWKSYFDASYKNFYDHFSTGSTARTEVVYTGANDGKLHCFQTSNGAELWSYVPYSLLKKLKEPALSPLQATSHTYFIDGKSLVKDIKVPKNDGTYYNDYRDWKTGLFFGLGIGGRAYCALDISSPVDPYGNATFKVLWEMNDSAETVANGYMGYTEAKPVQVDMFGGSTLMHFPGMVLAGGFNAAEVQATDLSAQEWQRREGKALYIVNADSGALIKKFIYGATASNSATLYQNPNFLTALTAAPAVLDKNNDGYADVIYVAESGDYRVANDHGGAIWKINCYGEPSTWTAQKIYQAPAGQTIFVSPSLAYDTDYRVWVMFGTGRRSRPAEGLGAGFTNLTGQFVAFIDDDSGTSITNANLHNAATAIASPLATDFTIDDEGVVKKGFYFDFLLANEIMFEPQPLYVNSKVYFMTFTPREGIGSSGSTDDPCGGSSAVNGSHYIYQFKLTSQGNTFTIGDFLSQSGKILGYGPIDDEFTIYVGAGDAGNFKSDESKRKRDNLKDSYRALLWKEDKK